MIAILLTASHAHSQRLSNPDVTCLPNSQLINALKKIDSLDVMKQEVASLGAQLSILQQRIVVKDQALQIAQLRQGQTDALVINLKGQVATRDLRITGLGTQVRRQKVAKWVSITLGVVGIVTTGYIFSH